MKSKTWLMYKTWIGRSKHHVLCSSMFAKQEGVNNADTDTQ